MFQENTGCFKTDFPVCGGHYCVSISELFYLVLLPNGLLFPNNSNCFVSPWRVQIEIGATTDGRTKESGFTDGKFPNAFLSLSPQPSSVLRTERLQDYL